MAGCNVSFEFLPMVCQTNGVSDQWSVTTFARVHSNARTVHPLCTVRALLCTLANVSVSTLPSPSDSYHPVYHSPASFSHTLWHRHRKRWASVTEVGPAIIQHWFNA